MFSFYYSIIEANEEEFYCDISEKYDAVINSNFAYLNPL